MAISHVGSVADGTASRTTSTTITLNFATAAGDWIFVVATNGGANADPTIGGTVVSTGGVSFAKVAGLNGGGTTTLTGIVFAGKATGNHNTQTIVSSGFTDSAASVCTVLRGADATAPVLVTGTVLDASGTNTLAALTAGTAGCWVVLGLSCDDNITSTSTVATDPAVITVRAEHLSSGGVDTGAEVSAAAMSGTGSTGQMSWTNARGAGLYLVAMGLLIRPPITDGETGAGADAGESVAVALTDGDTGAGADAGEAVTITVTDSDTATGADAEVTIVIPMSDADTATAADAESALSAAATNGDTAAGADAGEAVTVATTGADTGAGVDAGESAATAIVDGETGTGVDAGEALTTTVADSDTGAGVDAGENVNVPGGTTPTSDETATATDVEDTLTVAVADADTATGQDDEAVDDGTVGGCILLESGSTLLLEDDSGCIAREDTVGAVQVTDSDTAVAVETESVQVVTLVLFGWPPPFRSTAFAVRAQASNLTVEHHSSLIVSEKESAGLEVREQSSELEIFA